MFSQSTLALLILAVSSLNLNQNVPAGEVAATPAVRDPNTYYHTYKTKEDTMAAFNNIKAAYYKVSVQKFDSTHYEDLFKTVSNPLADINSCQEQIKIAPTNNINTIIVQGFKPTGKKTYKACLTAFKDANIKVVIQLDIAALTGTPKESSKFSPYKYDDVILHQKIVEDLAYYKDLISAFYIPSIQNPDYNADTDKLALAYTKEIIKNVKASLKKHTYSVDTLVGTEYVLDSNFDNLQEYLYYITSSDDDYSSDFAIITHKAFQTSANYQQNAFLNTLSSAHLPLVLNFEHTSAACNSVDTKFNDLCKYFTSNTYNYLEFQGHTIIDKTTSKGLILEANLDDRRFDLIRNTILSQGPEKVVVFDKTVNENKTIEGSKKYLTQNHIYTHYNAKIEERETNPKIISDICECAINSSKNIFTLKNLTPADITKVNAKLTQYNPVASQLQLTDTSSTFDSTKFNVNKNIIMALLFEHINNDNFTISIKNTVYTESMLSPCQQNQVEQYLIKQIFESSKYQLNKRDTSFSELLTTLYNKEPNPKYTETCSAMIDSWTIPSKRVKQEIQPTPVETTTKSTGSSTGGANTIALSSGLLMLVISALAY